MKIAILNKYQKKVYRGAESFVHELGGRLSKNHCVSIIWDINYFDLLKGKYDIIIPTNGRLQVILVRIITWLTGAKMVVSGHSGIGWDDKVNLYAFPDTFVALTKKAEIWAKKVNPLVKVVRIPNGVDLTRFKIGDHRLKNKKETTRSCRGDPCKIVLAVGAFTEQKRLNLAIDAVAELGGSKLIVAGGGGDLKEKIKDYGLKILGKEKFEAVSVPFEKMPEVYRSADVFTLPSKSSESFGSVLIEAMASGLPVVVTDDPVRREIVGDAGIFVDPTDVEEYAEGLRAALDMDWDDKPRRQAEKFSWDMVAEKYESLFQRFSDKS